MARVLRGAALALVAALLVGCTARVPVVEVEAQPSPEPVPTTPSPTATPSPTVGPSPTDSPSPTEEPSRPATNTDRARFVASYQPDRATSLQHVATDLDGDGTQELLFAYVRSGRVAQVDIAWWNGTAYEVLFGDAGGAATSIDRLRATDLNADGLTEVITGQSGDDGQASVSIWQVQGVGEVVRLPAAGGCYAGSHTYGVRGVTFEDRDADDAEEIYTTCRDGSQVRYRWEVGAYRHAPQLVP